MRAAARDMWQARSSREQILLAVLALLALAALLLVAVVRPLETARARAAADIRTYDMLAMRLRAAGPGLAADMHRGPPAQIVSQTAAASGLTVQRVEPENGKLRVVFADAPFEAVLRWVSEIERTSALRIGEAQIERSAQGNGVSAQFLLAGG
ncbi:type II secretion system protein GspM [Sphingomonas sp. MMS24-J13]|uniref:type II secretion system protein GspM n=1 Tax=Sphingomonas sp. MMS24-J13 TaxID=3238686 RepID=UPI003851288D